MTVNNSENEPIATSTRVPPEKPVEESEAEEVVEATAIPTTTRAP